MKFRKGDKIKIITGNDRGKSGKIIAVFPGSGMIVVEGINVKKKHIRARREGQKGELVRIPAPFPASRAMIICGSCQKPVRIAYRTAQEKKDRICRKCNQGL